MPPSGRGAVGACTYGVSSIPAAISPAASFAAEHRDGELHLSGGLTLAGASALWRAIHDVASRQRGGRLDIGLGDVEVVDGAALSLLVDLRADLVARGTACEIVGATERVRPLVELYGGYARVPAR